MKISGDLFPIFVLNYEGQQLLKEFKLEDVLEEEIEWHKSYKAKEFSSTMDLEVVHKYKLHYLSYKDYSSFLINAVVAKNNIGQFLQLEVAWYIIIVGLTTYNITI